MTLLFVISWALMVCGCTYLAREAEVLDRPRGWVIKRALDGIQSAQDAPGCPDGAAVGSRHRFAQFAARMLDCAPCTSAWVSTPCASLLWCLQYMDEWLRYSVVGLIVLPISAVGMNWIIAVLSPLQAMHRNRGGDDAERS